MEPEGKGVARQLQIVERKKIPAQPSFTKGFKLLRYLIKRVLQLLSLIVASFKARCHCNAYYIAVQRILKLIWGTFQRAKVLGFFGVFFALLGHFYHSATR